MPRNFLPLEYTARLDLDPAKDRFQGTITIRGTIDQLSAAIWLHGRRLAIERARAKQNNTELEVVVTHHDEDLLQLKPSKPLEAGEWTFLIDYAGELDSINTTGAFKQTVENKPYIFTQLQAVYARRVFPCFDEPDNKVPWTLTLDIPSKLIAVANTPITRETPLDENKKRIEFATTKPVPSYLVAFGVGPFELVDAGKSKRGIPVRIVTLANRAAHAAFAAKNTAKILDLTEEYFGIPYPYEKLDLLSIPLTVGFGAMENAGLITMTETLLLLDNPSKSYRYYWSSVTGHEVAHQWFGDLVTMKYWDDIWLNEGFAVWLEHKISQQFDPPARDVEAFIDTRNGALEADSLVSARQIRQPIESTDDILNAFDGITYRKGAAVLQMFENYVGSEVFQRGVREYTSSRAWGNATSSDFVAAISKTHGADLAPAFATFLDQAGAPEISASIACSGAPSVVLEQRRYLPPGALVPPQTKPWIVPVCVAYDQRGKRATLCTLLDKSSATIALDTKQCPRWLMPNVEGRGYYRNRYTAAEVETLRDVAWPELTWTERRVLYFDVRAAAMTGKLPLATALSLVPKMFAGGDRFTVRPALDLPLDLDELVPDELRDRYTAWIRDTFGPPARAVGFSPKDDDSLDVEITRRSLVSAVAWTGRDPELVKSAVELAEHWRELPQAMRALVLGVAVDAKPEIFEQIKNDLKTEGDRTRRREMYDALGGVRNLERQSAAHVLVLDPELDIRESLSMLHRASNDAMRANAQRFFREHQEEILKRMPKDESSGSSARLSRLFTSTCKADQREAIVEYVTKTFAGLPGGARVVKQNIEAMDQCIARRALLEPEIREWLSDKPARVPAKVQ